MLREQASMDLCLTSYILGVVSGIALLVMLQDVARRWAGEVLDRPTWPGDRSSCEDEDQ